MSDGWQIQIRPLREDDLTHILKLTHLVPEAPWWNEAHIRQLTQSANIDHTPDAHFRKGWVATAESPEDSGVWGFVVMQAVRIGLSELECEIESIVVHPDFRRHGVGRRLLQAAIDWCRQNAAPMLRLEVRHGNVPAIRLYERAGFVAAGTRPRYYEAPPEDALLMELTVLPE